MRDEWYVARRGQDGNKRYGPVPLHELRDLLDAGKVRGEDLVWREGMGNWQRADECAALAPPGPPPPEPRRYPPVDRGDDLYGRDPRGPVRAFDDRPFPRPITRRRSSGAVVALVVGGIVLTVGLLACGAAVCYILLNSRNSAFKSAAASPAVTLADLGDDVPYGLSELYYTSNVAPGDAEAVEAYLSKIGYFSTDRSVVVQLDKDDAGTFELRCCVKPGTAWDANVVAGFQTLRADLSSKVLYAPTEVHLCDEQMQDLRTLSASD